MCPKHGNKRRRNNFQLALYHRPRLIVVGLILVSVWTRSLIVQWTLEQELLGVVLDNLPTTQNQNQNTPDDLEFSQQTTPTKATNFVPIRNQDLSGNATTNNHNDHNNRTTIKLNDDDSFTNLRKFEDDTFQIQNLKLLDEDEISCGNKKCFFPLKKKTTKKDSNSRQIQIGYLVLQEHTTKKLIETERIWNATWNLSQSFYHQSSSSKFGVHHHHHQQQVLQNENLLLEPPQRMNISQTFATALNTALLLKTTTTQSSNRRKRRTKEPNSSNSPPPPQRGRYQKGIILIQKVQQIPKPSLLFGCYPFKSNNFFEKWETELLPFVINGTEKKNENENETIDDDDDDTNNEMKHNNKNYTNFKQQLLANIQKLQKKMKQTRHEHCLATDFQIIIDHYGSIYHIDLDRTITTNGVLLKCTSRENHRLQKCLSKFQNKIINLL